MVQFVLHMRRGQFLHRNNVHVAFQRIFGKNRFLKINLINVINIDLFILIQESLKESIDMLLLLVRPCTLRCLLKLPSVAHL